MVKFKTIRVIDRDRGETILLEKVNAKDHARRKAELKKRYLIERFSVQDW